MGILLRSSRTLVLQLLNVCLGMALPAFFVSAVADVSYTPQSQSKIATISVTGEIRRDDLKHFVEFSLAALRDSTVDFFRVELDSTGGDVKTALAMGRILRVAKAQAAVPRNAKCFSSCVFLLAGATIRYVDGSIGIHRPYAPHDVNTTAAAQKQWYDRLEKEVKAFLKEVNIPQELYDHMIRIPPERMTLLGRNDLQRYGLSEDDPFETAATDASLARSLGISTQELIRRKAKAAAECSSLDSEASFRCNNRVLTQGR